jgi:hypothetical protein
VAGLFERESPEEPKLGDLALAGIEVCEFGRV